MNKSKRPPRPAMHPDGSFNHSLKGFAYWLDPFDRRDAAGNLGYVLKHEYQEYEAAIALLNARILTERQVAKRECCDDPDWLAWLVKERYITPVDRRRRPWAFNEEQLRRDRKLRDCEQFPVPTDDDILTLPKYLAYLTTQDAADRAGVTKRYIAQQIAAKTIPVVTIGRRVIIDPKALNTWSRTRNTKRGPKPRSPSAR